MNFGSPSYYQKVGKGHSRGAVAPKPKANTYGKVSWKCSHGDCNGCTKLDCPHECHVVEK
jgi:hypothetical protein